MKYKTAPMSMAIKVITFCICFLTIAFLVLAIFFPEIWFVSIVFLIVVPLCYCWSPREYEIKDNILKVKYQWGEKDFQKILNVSPVEEKLGFGIRLFGNGGVFCGAGIFWCRKIGIFRAYLTSARIEDQAIIQTETHKVLISPENRDRFIQDFNASQ